MKQLEQKKIGRKLSQRSNGAVAKCCVSCFRLGMQFFAVEIPLRKRSQHARRHIGVRQGRYFANLRRSEYWPVLRQEKATVRRRSTQKHILERGPLAASCTDKFH